MNYPRNMTLEESERWAYATGNTRDAQIFACGLEADESLDLENRKLESLLEEEQRRVENWMHDARQAEELADDRKKCIDDLKFKIRRLLDSV